MAGLKLSEKEQKVLFLIEDRVEDTVTIGADTGIPENKLNKVFEKLEKAGLVSVERKDRKPYSVKITSAGESYMEKNKKIRVC